RAHVKKLIATAAALTLSAALIVGIVAPTVYSITNPFLNGGNMAEVPNSADENAGAAPVKDMATIYKKDYSLHELEQIASSSFKKLNEVEYPASSAHYSVSAEYESAVTAFTDKIYRTTALKSEENFSFSPLGLYNTLSILSLASDNAATLAALNELLGMGGSDSRKQDFIDAYKTDFFLSETGTMQLYNGSFQTDRYTPNPSYISALTERFTEAYQLNFQDDNDVKTMFDWVDAKIGEKDFLTKEDLEIDENSALVLFSTLYFDVQWQNDFDDELTTEMNFYPQDGNAIRTEFMRHAYYGEAYDYGNYISCYDYYHNGIKVKYILPKDGKTDIYSLVNGVNFLTDDSSKKLNRGGDLIVNLSVPKFDFESGVMDFSDTLKACGLSSLFEEDSYSFNYAFADAIDTSVYLKYVKQKNKISFSEGGTEIKSVTSIGAKDDSAESAAPTPVVSVMTIDVTLNRPFIYVIYDSNDLPIYIGHVDKP
ncbi:MAG: hypothetical protein J6Z36_01975, partial [Clostridia bacterium]|nr:hypothetical protein [Clostridia bacterium]